MHFPNPIRLPREAYANPDNRFHLTIAAHPEIPKFADAVRDVVWASVVEQRSSDRVELLAACLMPDHLHLVAAPAARDLISFVQQWKSWSTRLAWGAGHIGPLWQPSVWDRGIRREEDFEVVCRYVLDNPVRANLVTEPGEWPWSWAYWMHE